MKISLNNLKNKHKGETCYIVGNGPSVKLFEHDILTTPNITIGMNRTAEELDTDYYCLIRGSIWEDYLDDISGTILCLGNVGCTNADWMGRIYATVKPTKNKSGDLLDGHKSSNTGVFAIYMAGWMGFSKAILFGYDCGVEGHYGEHSIVMDRTPIAKRFDERWGPEISAAFPDLEILNANIDSKITYWPYKDVRSNSDSD
jgi:hypothetical protein